MMEACQQVGQRFVKVVDRGHLDVRVPFFNPGGPLLCVKRRFESGGNVLVYVPDTQHVLCMREHLLDCTHECPFAVGDDDSWRHVVWRQKRFQARQRPAVVLLSFASHEANKGGKCLLCCGYAYAMKQWHPEDVRLVRGVK